MDALYPTVARQSPPSTHGLPVVGSLPALLRRPFDFLLESRERYGDIYTLDAGILKWVMLNHPRHIEHILRDNVQNYSKGGPFWASIRTLLGNGLVVSEGDFWLRQRRMMQPHFHRQRLVGLTTAMVDASAESLLDWDAEAQGGAPSNVTPHFARMTMRVIVRALFGQGMTREELEETSELMAFIIDYLLMGAAATSLPQWMPIPRARRYREALNRVDKLIYRIIERERKAAPPSDSLLAMLLDMADAETGERMTDQQLRDEVMTLFAAGYETTSLTLSWTIDLLTRHPEVMAKLQAEIDTVLDGRAPAFADLPALAYTRQVLQEAMRLRPPAWMLPRVAVADDEIDGFAIPAGTVVVALTYGVHHNPDVWDDPERFDPERFAGDDGLKHHKMAWIPFGAGQRQCIGRDFAIMEAQIILAMLVQRYTFTAVPGRVAEPSLSTTLAPRGGVWVKMERRNA